MVSNQRKKLWLKIGLSLGLVGIAFLLSGNLALAADPTLVNVKTWFTTEVQIAIGIVAVVVIIGLGVKQQIGKAVGVFLFSAFIFFMANDPAKIFKAVGGLFGKIFGA